MAVPSLRSLERLVPVDPALPPAQAQRARLAGAFLGTLTITGLVAMLASMAVGGGGWRVTETVAIVALAAIGFGFYLTRTRRPELGSLIACGTVIATVGLLQAGGEGLDHTLLYFYAIPILIAGLLLPRRWTIAVLALVFVVALPLDILLNDNVAHDLGAEVTVYALLGIIAGMALVFGHLTSHDMQLLQQTSSRLEQANQTIQRQSDDRIRLLQQLAHDLAAPLTPVKLHLELLRRGTGDTTKRLEIIGRNLEHQRRLIDDVRDLATIQGGRLTIQPQPVDLADVVRDVAESFQASALDRGVGIQVAAADGMTVAADPGRLHQVVVNLVGNALKFSPPQGEVAIDAQRLDGHVRVSVRDQGPGMTGPQMSRLFQAFSQVHEAGVITRAEDKGTGLGLYISKGLVEAHGGRIGAQSEGPGKGAEFWFELPAVGK